MAKKHLTDRAIRAAKPDPTTRLEFADTVQPGLYLIVQPSGVKSFAVRYKHFGKSRKLTLGQYPDVNLTRARSRARDARSKVAEGIDPVAENQDARRAAVLADQKADAGRFDAVVNDFIEKYAKPRQKTWKETERVLRSIPWSDRQIAEITRRDAYALLDGFVAAGNGPKARVTLAWLKTLWRWAWKRDIVSEPVMDALEIDFERRIRDRHYTDEEVKAVWRAADRLIAKEAGFVKLLTLLGVRKGELADMRRSELDDPEEPMLWIIPHERTKTKKSSSRERRYLVPIPPLAQRILHQIPKEKGVEDLVFPGRHHGKSLDPGTPLKERVREKSGIDDWTFHPCRDTISTWLENQGHSEYERALILNHAGGGTVTSDYSHGYPLDLKRQLLEKWADHVEQVVKPKGATHLLS